ncbi:CDP-glycerol glycerophosphotransferase family protein [Microbaculum marinum]|uniref:CDP-glycerol glycerophosphotransferase family protein n=1 Tax=Microbaculum marinum TaxID=1764581 RepID=A0AAW9RI30_9HYPH
MQEGGDNIAIILVYDWHKTMLVPLQTILGSRGHSTELLRLEDVRAGRRPVRVPDLLITADAGAARYLNETFPGIPLLHVGHGLISKNQPGLHYGLVDYICVAGEETAARLTARGHTPRRRFFATGLIQSDPLFRGDAEPVRIAGCATNVVYAPTWNPALSSAAMLGPRLVENIRGADTGIGIGIKPHPHIAVAQPELIDLWAQLAAGHPNVVLHDHDDDLMPILLGADLLVSDVSSAVFHFLALDRPIVLVDNPDRIAHPQAYDPDGIEWTWRDIGRRVDSAEALADAVLAELADPEVRRPVRLARKAQLFGTLTDGRARDRVADAVDEILAFERRCGTG